MVAGGRPEAHGFRNEGGPTGPPGPRHAIMKTPDSKTDSQQLAGNVQTARLRVATAENRWKAAKEQARVAKRRRKEARLIARRTRKQAKQAKADLAEAREALAEAEAKLARSGTRTAAAKTKKTPAAKATAAPRRQKAARPAASASPKPVTPRTLGGMPTTPVSGVRPRARKGKQSVVVARGSEKAVTIASLPGGKPTVQTERGGEETRPGETEAVPARKSQTVPSALSPAPGPATK